MSEVNYLFHVNDDKNDFVKWIRDVIKDKELANRLSTIDLVSTIDDVIKIINQRITGSNIPRARIIK